jgi:hypothetical protein
MNSWSMLLIVAAVYAVLVIVDRLIDDLAEGMTGGKG